MPSRTNARKRAPTRAGRGKRSTVALSPDAIAREALKLIDAHGLDELSTRKLGRALGCEAMAIYWYYPSKEAVLDAVVDRLMVPVAAAASGDDRDWVAALREVAHAYRRLAHEHPKAFPLLATRRFASEGTYAFLDRLFALARRRGVSDRTAARMFRVVSSYCNGFALNELADRREPDTRPLRQRFERVAAVSAWLEPRHLDDIFDFGLEILLDALLERRGARGRGVRGVARAEAAGTLAREEGSTDLRRVGSESQEDT